MRTGGVRRVSAVAVALALPAAALFGCADDAGTDADADPGSSTITSAASPSTTATDEIPAVDGLRAAVERSRLLSAQRMFELIVVNDTTAARNLTAYRLESPLFELIPLHERDVSLRTDGARISVPLPYGAPRCARSDPAGRSTVTVVVDGSRRRLDLDDAALRQQHEAECAQQRVESAVSIAFGDSWEPGAAGTLAGEIVIDRRRHDVTAVVEEVAGTVVLSLRFDGDVSSDLRVDDDRARGRARVVVSVSGCSAHALIESKKTYRFPAWVSLGGEPAVRIELEPTGEARRSMEGLLAACQP